MAKAMAPEGRQPCQTPGLHLRENTDTIISVLTHSLSSHEGWWLLEPVFNI